MNTKIIGIVIAIIIIGGGYYLFSTQTRSTPATTTQAQPASESSNTVTIRLNAENNSGETGIAELTEKNGKVEVSLSLTGAPDGVMQPAHIHVGSCPDVGAVKYPLTSPVNGKSKTTLEVSLSDLRAGLPLAINVHKSASEIKTYVACGDITF